MVKFPVAVIGNCYFDEIYTIGKFPNPDDKILAQDLMIILGGSATNTSVGMAKLGLKPYLFTVMGDDDDAYRLFKLIREKGIQTPYINHIDGKSGRTVILLDDNKKSTKIGYQGVCSDMTETILFEGLSNPDFRHVHLSSASVKTIKQALKYKNGKSFSIDFGAKTQNASDEELLDVMQHLDFVFMNDDIFNRLFDKTVDALDTVDTSYDLIITAGKDGIYGLIDGKSYHKSIIPVDVTDSTGAGDAVAAAVIYAYLHDKNPDEILEFGIKAASIKIQTFGGSNGHATLDQLVSFS